MIVITTYIEGGFQPFRGADPKSVVPSAKSIITAVYDASKVSFPQKLVGKVGRLYQARVCLAPKDHINGARRQLMRDFLEKIGCQVAPRLIVPERLAAARAGLTTYEKNTFANADSIESFIVITSFVVDMELSYDAFPAEVKCPDKCKVCIDSCPTGAIYEPLKMNSRCCTKGPTKPGISYPQSFYRPGGKKKAKSRIF